MSSSKTVVYHKLVRDLIPQIIEASGDTCVTRILDRDDYIDCLETKLTEELNEYLSSKDAEELADLLEVVDALINARGWSREEVEQIRLGKKEKRGGFAERIYLESVSRRATNEAE